MNMDSKVTQVDFKHILIDEIALEGLEGIGIDLLWRRVEKRISSSVTEKMKNRFWKFIINNEKISFYQLPQPVVHIDIIDRFTLIDKESGYLVDPEDFLDGPYEYCPVKNEYGSCIHYKTRTLLPKSHIQALPYDKVIAEYGDTLIMVASIEARWQALAPHMTITYLKQLTPVHYCILELVGRARENGQMTVGKTNLTKIVKDSKLLFYNRNQLQKLDLVRVQHITQISSKGNNKSLLLRLKRFHQPSVLSMPKVGKIHDVVEYLIAQPDYSEKTDVIMKKGMLVQQQIKRLQKTINIFSFDEKLVKTEGNPNKKSKNPSVAVKKKFISLTPKSDESSQSDDEPSETSYKYQNKSGENLLRQAYERFLETGLKGLTQMEIAQMLGVEYYTSRTICRKFKSRNIIRQFLEDKGRQRTARFIAVAATEEMDVKYAKEKRKFLEYLDDTVKLNKNEIQPNSSGDAGSSEVPRKKIKLESNEGNVAKENDNMDIDIIENEITEVKVSGLKNPNNDSLLHSKRNLTLRQLRFANGVLKVTREKLCVSGYQTLSTLVSKEIGEPPMDNKALKSFVQKLVTDGQLKILKLKWPGFQQKYSVLICAPYVKGSDPIVKAIYKEICIRAYSNKKLKMKKDIIENVSRPLSQFAYPRYMKIQKLHEFLVKFMYFNDVKVELFDMPEGFTSLINIIPEITVEFAVGNISNMAMSDISHLKISDHILNLKLRDAPDDLYKVLLQSKSLNNSLKINLKVLAMLGLIQLIAQPSSSNVDYSCSVLNSVFYVNRHAKIIDTTGVWPREDADITSLEKKFYFEKFEDVKDYWNVVYDVSINTTIKLPCRGRKKLLPPTRLENEVLSFDNGNCFGDGLGPCGFDSGFYMEIPRLWRAFYVRVTRMKQTEKERKPRIKIPKIKINKKQTSIPKIKKKNSSRINEEEIFLEKLRPKRHNDSLIKWSKWDDNIIMMCKAAIIIMSPSSQPGCLKVRNLVAKDILSINDPKKTGSICHRRATTLESNSTLAHEKECIINELRRRRNLIHKYEGLLKKLRIRYSANMTKFINEARIPMLELVWIISQVSKSKALSLKVPCVAMDFEEFHRNYTITSSTANRSYNMYKTPECESEIATLKEGIVLTVMLDFNNVINSGIASKIYSIFKACPERTLRTALEQLRKCGAVVAKDKILNCHMHKFYLKDMVQSSYKISAFYRRKWTNRLNSEFIDNLGECLDKELVQNCIKGAPEINCLYCELQTCNILEIICITVPVITGSSGSIIQEEQLNVIDIEVKYKLKSGTLGWKNKSNMSNFSELYQNLEYEEYLESLSRNAVVYYTNSQELDVEDKIITHLKEKSEKGSTFSEIQDLCECDEKTLINRLCELESKNILKRIGYYENRIVLTQFLKQWLMNVEEKYIVPAPWLTLEPDIRYDIFLKWTGVIMNKVFEHPGCSLSYLAGSAEFLTTRGAQDISMFLEKCECVTLHVMKTPEVDLFSDDDIPELCDFNQYESPDNILVFPVKDSLTKYAYVRRKILEKYCNNDLSP